MPVCWHSIDPRARVAPLCVLRHPGGRGSRRMRDRTAVACTACCRFAGGGVVARQMPLSASGIIGEGWLAPLTRRGGALSHGAWNGRGLWGGGGPGPGARLCWCVCGCVLGVVGPGPGVSEAPLRSAGSPAQGPAPHAANNRDRNAARGKWSVSMCSHIPKIGGNTPVTLLWPCECRRCIPIWGKGDCPFPYSRNFSDLEVDRRGTAAGILMPPRVRCPHSIATMGTKLNAQLNVRNLRNMPTGAQMRMGLEY